MSTPYVGVPSVGMLVVGFPSVGMPLVGIPSVGMPLVGIPFVDIPVKCIGSNEPTRHLPSSAKLQSNLEKYPSHPLHIIQSRQKTNLNVTFRS